MDAAAHRKALAQKTNGHGDLSVGYLQRGEADDPDPGGGDPSYSAAVTPDQLASEGAELGYDTLADAVADPVDGGL